MCRCAGVWGVRRACVFVQDAVATSSSQVRSEQASGRALRPLPTVCVTSQSDWVTMTSGARRSISAASTVYSPMPASPSFFGGGGRGRDGAGSAQVEIPRLVSRFGCNTAAGARRARRPGPRTFVQGLDHLQAGAARSTSASSGPARRKPHPRPPPAEHPARGRPTMAPGKATPGARALHAPTTAAAACRAPR